jgi:hypothetical protein
MKPGQIISVQELAQLQEKGDVHVSIFLPLHNDASGKRLDAYSVKKKVADVKDQLAKQYDVAEIGPLLQALNELPDEITFNHNWGGIGLFVSNKVKTWMPFYFPVQEKCTVADTFATRDLQYQDFYALPYHVLLLSKDEARLFEGLFDALTEITDAHFPVKFEDNFEYSRPSRGLSYEGHAVTKDFERDKSQLVELRVEKFLQQVDDLLKLYLTEYDPLVLSGIEKELSYFSGATTHASVAGNLYGNYFYLSISTLGESTWRLMKNFLQKKKHQLLQQFVEKAGLGQTESGVANCWQAAWQGRGASLLVERNFAVPGFLADEHPEYLCMEAPAGPLKVLPDAVSALVDLVQEKGGEVVLVEDDELKEYEHVGLVTRY